MHACLINDSKWAVSVNVSMNDCLSLHISPVDGLSTHFYHDSWNGLQLSCKHELAQQLKLMHKETESLNRNNTEMYYASFQI